jgi:Resolvase, N terminal domain
VVPTRTVIAWQALQALFVPRIHRATFKSLGDAWADTTTPAGKLMLTVLGGLAEYERHLILTRTAEGRTGAQANGVRFLCDPQWRMHRETPQQLHQSLAAVEADEAAAAKSYGPNISDLILLIRSFQRTFRWLRPVNLQRLSREGIAVRNFPRIEPVQEPMLALRRSAVGEGIWDYIALRFPLQPIVANG